MHFNVWFTGNSNTECVACCVSQVTYNKEVKLWTIYIGGGPATWSVTLKDKCKLRVFLNRVLRMIVACKTKIAVPQFALRTRYCLGDTIRKNMMGRACGAHCRNKTY